MDENLLFIDIITSIGSLIAVVISILSYINSKRKTTAETITVNRIEWIKMVREYCGKFLIEFNREKPDVRLLEELFIKIQLYGYGDTYDELFGLLNECILSLKQSINDEEKSRLSQKVLMGSQKVLNGVWWRMKREGGISTLKDKSIKKQYDKIYKK